MPLTPGTRLGRYEIIRLLGAGGMGEVYLANDERLEREVALKVLPTGTLADESARKRFRREALALSKLNHPNIETVYDFDTEGRVDFLVMEYIPGETLDENLAAGALTEKVIVSLGTQLVEGLAAAHAQGVIHRDLKPGNLRATPDGRLKILDFGLAKLLEPVTKGSKVQTISQSGSTAGTMPYMAPEQLRAEKVDARTDLFALGAVLYEMAAGQRAFPGDNPASVTDAILNRAPVSPRAVNTRVSPDLERVVLKCLEKEPEDRYQAAKEVGVDLRRLTRPASGPMDAPVPPAGIAVRKHMVTAAISVVALLVLLVVLNVGGLRGRLFGGASPAHIQSLAVLPLENLSGDPEQEYFADGMTDALITGLSKISALKVISRTSAMRYKSKDRPPLPEIAQQLGVDALIEGSVLRVGNRVRITAQLIEAATDQHLWAENYERDFGDILALQGEVARAIAEEIEVALTPQEETDLTGARPVDPVAFESYLKCRYYLSKWVDEGRLKGNECFRRAVEKSPHHALTYAGLAESYYLLGEWGLLPPGESFPEARTAALKALELDDTLGEAHWVLGMVALEYEWDWGKAERELQLAIELNPGSADSHHMYAVYLVAMGRFEEANAEITQARILDPLDHGMSSDAAWVLLYQQEYDDAVEQYRRTLELEPTFSMAHRELARAYSHKGMHDEALAEAQEAVRLSNGDPDDIVILGYVHALAGSEEQALNIIQQLQASSGYHNQAHSIAEIYVGLGDTDQALNWLERAFERRNTWIFLLKVDPLFDPIRSNSRFQQLIRRMRFPSY
jgi:serine/threonine protein kinase/Tfp pilus assembly protein PilF